MGISLYLKPESKQMYTAQDIFEQLYGVIDCDELLIPENCLKADEDVFLCGMTLSELSERLSVKLRISLNDGCDFIDAIIGNE